MAIKKATGVPAAFFVEIVSPKFFCTFNFPNSTGYETI